MADTDVIKEFLVSLGFKVDDSSYRKFENAVKGSSNLAADLGKVATAAVISTTAAVAKVSEVMDKLYFVSQRTGSSVSSIQAFDYAISQTGGSADGAKQSLENLSHFIRAYPGGADFPKASRRFFGKHKRRRKIHEGSSKGFSGHAAPSGYDLRKYAWDRRENVPFHAKRGIEQIS
jgi:hypothetical protein